MRYVEAVLKNLTKKELRRGRKLNAGGALPVFYCNYAASSTEKEIGPFTQVFLAITCAGKRGPQNAAQELPGGFTVGGDVLTGASSSGPSGGFSPFDWNLLNVFCHGVSAAIEKILMKNEESLNNTRMDNVFSYCARLFTERNHQVLYSSMGDFTGKLFGFEHASVLFYDHKTEMLYQLVEA